MINFWREITSSVLGFQNNNGGVTNHFLASLVENTFSNSTIEIGWKNTDTERESGELNEKITLQNVKRHVDAKYNIARLQGSYEDIRQLENRSFNRINILEDGHLYCYSDFNENLQISGVDCLDIISHLEILSGNKHYGLVSRSNNT